MRLLQRYLDGHHAQVWTDLLGVGPGLRDDTDDRAEAEAIAAETMARVRRNVERVRDGLPALGYRFTNPSAVIAPAADAAAQIINTEAAIGPLPLSVSAFWEHVGAVDLSGSHPDWPHRLTDPLMVEFDASYIVDTYEDQVDQGYLRRGDPFQVDFAPDDLHKADISGGPPYAIEAPNPRADGIVLWEIHQTTFVNYLRVVMTHAGMGGFSPIKRHGHDPLPVPAGVRELAATLEAF